jgi:regulator of sirC expression with transglutaminase-like and TPR domain
VDSALRLARATAANTQGDYANALELVTEQDAEVSVGRAEGQIQEALNVLGIRADAFYGQNRWPLALTNYSRMLNLRPDNLAALNGVGLCYWQLRLPAVAFNNFTQVVEIQERLVKAGRSELTPDLADSLNNRGNA